MIEGRSFIRKITMAILAVYWAGFWLSFFQNAVPLPAVRPYEAIGPLYHVFNKGLGENAAAIMRMPWFVSSFWLHILCFLITWPLTRMRSTGDLLGTNVEGFRLILVTLLSFLQWGLVIAWIERFQQSQRRSRNRWRVASATAARKISKT